MEGIPRDIDEVIDAVCADEPIIAIHLRDALEDKFDYHGHSWLAEVEWNYTEHQLDEHFWGPDFGKVKDMIRELDHHNLNLMFAQPTAEFLAKHLFEKFTEVFGFMPDLVKLHEGRGNMVIYRGE